MFTFTLPNGHGLTIREEVIQGFTVNPNTCEVVVITNLPDYRYITLNANVGYEFINKFAPVTVCDFFTQTL